MKKSLVPIILIAILLTLGFAGYLLYIGPDPILVDPTQKLSDITIQPEDAIAIAEPFMKEHGTYMWKEDTELRRTVLRQKNWYFINDTNYPAKTLRYYMQPAVKVHVHTGEVAFSIR